MKCVFSRVPICILFLGLMVLGVDGCAGAKKPISPAQPVATDTTQHKLSVAAYEIANALDGGEKEYEALYTSNLPGVSDDDYAKTVFGMFLGAQKCTSEYIGELKSVVTIDASNQAQVSGWSNAVIACVNNLVDTGVASIKNTAAKQRIKDLLAPIPGAIKIITDALNLASAPKATLSIRPQIFTEVNLGSRNGSSSYRAGNPVGRERPRVFCKPEESDWPYRSTASGRSSQPERKRKGQNASVSRSDQRRWITNPSREAWLHT